MKFAYQFNKNSLIFFATFFFIIFIFQLITFRYFELDFLNNFLFAIDDIWCPPPDLKPILPRHCFGDYGHTVINAISTDPWGEFNNANPYPPISMPYFAFFHYIGQVFQSSGIGLLTYLVVMLISLSIPSLYLLVNQKTENRLLKFILLSPLLGAGIYAIDRGNIISLAVPWLFFSLLALNKKNYLSFAVFIFLASTIKPQFLLLLLILVLIRKFSILIFTILSYLAANLFVLVTLYDSFSIQYHLLRFLKTLQYFSHYQSVKTEGVENLSFARGLYLITKKFDIKLYDYNIGSKISLADYLDSYPNHFQFYLIFLLVSFLYFLYKMKNIETKIYDLYLVLLIFSVSLSHVAYQYYSAVFLAFIAFLLIGKERIFLSEKKSSHILKLYTFAYLALFLHPFYFFRIIYKDDSLILDLAHNSIYYLPVLTIIFFVLYALDFSGQKEFLNNDA